MTKDRNTQPDHEWDTAMIPFYEFENEEAKKLSLSQLSFSYKFEHENDIVFFAYF